jgi:hypothetical protein
MNVEEIKTRIAEEDKRWAEAEESMKQQFNQAFGAYRGRVSVFEEMLQDIEGPPAEVDGEVVPE